MPTPTGRVIRVASDPVAEALTARQVGTIYLKFRESLPIKMSIFSIVILKARRNKALQTESWMTTGWEFKFKSFWKSLCELYGHRASTKHTKHKTQNFLNLQTMLVGSSAIQASMRQGTLEEASVTLLCS